MELSKSGKPKYSNENFYLGNSAERKALSFIDTEKDLGVTFSSNLKFSKHIRIQANKATAILGQLRRTFRYWTIYTFKTLFSAYVRPHLEYAAVIWSPYNKKDKKILENVQRRATKLVPRIRNWSYKDRLAVLGLPTLCERRKRGDLIQLFKLENEINKINWVRPPAHCSSISQSGPAQGIRGHKRRISGQTSTNCAQRDHFFTNRVVNDWNNLPFAAINARSVDKFKVEYDRYISNLLD